MHRHLIRHGSRRRSRPRRVCEHMQISKRQMFDKAAAFLKELIGLSGEADHYIGADRRMGHGFMDFSDLLRVMPRAVLAMHPPQNAVTAGLQWHMRVLGNSR